MECVVKLSVETQNGKKSGKEYTAVFAQFQDGEKILISFDAQTILKVMSKSKK